MSDKRSPKSSTEYPYPFDRHCDKETAQPVSGTLTGSIPSWLQGDLVRIGPGIQKFGEYQYKHVFDGLAILHKFSIKDGNATYQSRILQSDTYKKNAEAKRIVVSEFGTRAYPDPCQSIFGRMQTEFKAWLTAFNKSESEEKITDNCSINTAYFGDQFYALGESTFLRQIDPTMLNTLGDKININDYVSVNSTTAHPHVLEDGTVINVGNIFRHRRGPHYGFIKIPPLYNSESTNFQSAQVFAEIPSRWTLSLGYFHSFGVTNSGKLIFVEYPLQTNLFGVVFGPVLGLGVNNSQSYNNYMTWSPNEKTRFYVVSIDNGKIHPVIYETDQLFSFHHINAFEQDGELVVDLIGYDNAEWVTKIISAENLKTLENYLDLPSARRYVLPLNVDFAKPGENLVKNCNTARAVLRPGKKKIVDVTPRYHGNYAIEFPRINYKFNGKKYRYFYGIEPGPPPHTYELGMQIISKVDVTTGVKVLWLADENCRVSEAVFVPDPMNGVTVEDSGVLLATLIHVEPTKISLLIINAKDMKEIGRVEFNALGPITDTFHGQWAQTEDTVHAY